MMLSLQQAKAKLTCQGVFFALSSATPWNDALIQPRLHLHHWPCTSGRA